MSSQQSFQASSPISPNATRRKKSKFTYRHFSQLASSSITSPLRVIAHVDLDAFYAQCEMVRMGVEEDQPLAVQQWQGLIAINYPARKFGLSRHIAMAEAKKLCPNLIFAHVALWREGDTMWRYRDDPNIATDKVALDPFRLESRRILACIKETLPASVQKVEKASIDEVFLDLSAQIHSIMMKRYPELNGPAPYDDPTELLPLPPTTALDWQADALVDLDAEETEDDDPDWDDVAILIGSEIVRDVRAAIRSQLKYTCSAGIAKNKMLAKLGSAHKKPNQQTIIRNRAVQQFLSDIRFTKIRGLGGKLGEQITSAFSTETVKDLLPVSLEHLKQKLGDDTGTWVHGIIRGQDSSEVNPRTQIKSMLSAKSFRPTINTPEQAYRWLRIFAADIYSRLVEEGVLENRRRPKTISLHHRSGGQTKSKSAPIPLGRKIDEAVLFELAKTLLGQVILEGRVWPCANISLSVGGFEDSVSGNMGIGAFLVKGEQSKPLGGGTREPSLLGSGHERAEKRRRVDGPSGIQRFFVKTDSTEEHDDDFGSHNLPGMDSVLAEEVDTESNDGEKVAVKLPQEIEAAKHFEHSPPTMTASFQQQHITDYICHRCSQALESSDALQSHQDWHFARDLQDEDRAQQARQPRTTSTATSGRSTGATGKKKGPRGKPEKGQSKLAFG